MTIRKKSLFCFGPGYTAAVIARALLKQNWEIFGTYRESEDAAALTAIGIEPVAFTAAEKWLEKAPYILSSVPPSQAGDPVLERYGDLLTELGASTWIGYLSTTGVYGDTGGAVVDEQAALKPSNERSQWRQTADQSWHKLSAHIFRLAGIYGPGRSSFERLRAGLARRIDHPGHLFSRIHVSDIRQTVIASMAQPNPGSVYNLSDDEAIEQQQVEAYAANLLGIEPPPLIAFAEAYQEMSPMAKTFWQDNRRIDNSKIKNELGIQLIYPTYREGLTALHQRGEGVG